MPSNITTEAATITPAKIDSQLPSNPQLSGTPAVVDAGFNINSFQVVYSLGALGTPAYTTLRSAVCQLIPKTQPGNPGFDALAPFNTASVPFLIPSSATMFGGALQVLSRSNIPVFWTVRSQFMKQGVPLTQSQNGAKFFDTQPGLAIEPFSSGLCGYLAILATHHWSFQPNDLPIGQPVHLQHKLQLFSDKAFANPLTDTSPADNVIGVWVMRTA